jgi:hypothetical protein
MTRAAFDLTYVLPFAACLVALACGHEASTPSPVAIPIATPVVAAPSAPATATTATAKTDDDGAPCVVVDTELGGTHITLEGRVVVDHAFEHPTRGKTRPYILRLDAPRCANGIEESRVTELHLASSENVALAPLVGKQVRVSGDPFAAHTAWHARPVVLMTTTATTLARR